MWVGMGTGIEIGDWEGGQEQGTDMGTRSKTEQDVGIECRNRAQICVDKAQG